MSNPKYSTSSYAQYTKQYQQDQPTTYDNERFQYNTQQQQPLQQSYQYNTVQQQHHQPPLSSNAYYANTVNLRSLRQNTYTTTRTTKSNGAMS